ncbi:hypothetical protein [Rubellimicrobium arenae]|uniref:hypothetical protein n=1 Tax=Rubellimicrobium arenae TaxID=2817372 RepID=UPI001B306F89|nr:hypothetical protein [Rubellimicrobium arenae]
MAMNDRDDLAGDDPTEDGLEDLFARARAQDPQPSADLMARLMADAARERPRPPVSAPVPRRADWRDWFRTLGGWPALGGFVAATAAGLWIGAAPPEGLSSVAPSLWGDSVTVAVGVDEDPLSVLESQS